MKEETERKVEGLKEKYQQEQKGFLYHRYNAFLVEQAKIIELKREFKVVMITLQAIPYYLYSREVKSHLREKGFIEINKNDVIIKNFKGSIESLYQFFKEKGLTNVESLKTNVKHVEWFYEV